MCRLAIVLLACAACDSCGGREASPEAAPAPEEPPAESEPAEAPPEPSPAELLARAIHRAAGGERLDDVGQLDFRFVVEQEGQTVFEATHQWNLDAKRDHVVFTDREGRAIDAVVDLDARVACGTVGGEVATGEAQDALSEQVYARWVNDAYWLMMPLKLLDPGVTLSLEAPRELEGRSHEILKLEFDGVGLTPGDRYWLYVDPETKRIVRWEMALEGQDGEPRAMSWSDYREVGPLVLAFDHATDDGARHVRFADVVARATPEDQGFRIPGCPDP